MPRGCGVGLLLGGWGCAVAGGVTVRAGAMAVSRMFHEAPRLTPKFHARFTSHQGRPGLFHARFTSHQRHGARRLRLDQRVTTRRHLTVVTPSRPRTRPTLSHAIPHGHRLTTPQKPHDFNVSVSKSEILAGELHATFVELHPSGSIAPVKEHYTRSERVQCSLIGCTASSATSDSADTRQGQLGPRQRVRRYAPFH